MTSSVSVGLYGHERHIEEPRRLRDTDWGRVRDTLTSDITQAPDTGGPNRHTSWLTTINPDGSPHVTPVGFVQLDGVWYFTSGPGTRKSRNVASDPRCVVSVAKHPFDLVIEGSAARVALQTAQVDGDALTAEYSAPSAGPPPWHVYKIIPSTVFAFGTDEPGGATRFDLTR